MLGCFLFKSFKNINESCSLPKAARMSSTYLKIKFRLYSLGHLHLSKPMKMLARTGTKGESVATPSM